MDISTVKRFCFTNFRHTFWQHERLNIAKLNKQQFSRNIASCTAKEKSEELNLCSSLSVMLRLVVFAILRHLVTLVSFDDDAVLAHRNRRSFLSSSVFVAKERTDLHTGYATVGPLLRGRWHERNDVCVHAYVCMSVYTCGVPCRTRKARPRVQRFKDSTPGAAEGDLSRNMCQQVLSRRSLEERLLAWPLHLTVVSFRLNEFILRGAYCQRELL